MGNALVPINNEIVLYQPNEETRLEVRLGDETVWLTQAQIAALFGTQRQAITKHLNNIFRSGELDELSVCSILELTAADGKNYKTKFYNLDAILSVGYRVNSVNATLFRQWANKVLKQYLIHGYALDERLQRIEKKLYQHDEQIGMLVKTALPPTEELFFNGQFYDAFAFTRNLFKSSTQSIIIIDNYIDESVLTMVTDKLQSVTVDIYTPQISNALQLAANKFNAQYGGLTLHNFNHSHDRFVIIDHTTLYFFGASLKDLGKKWFAVAELDPTNIPNILSKLPN